MLLHTILNIIIILLLLTIILTLAVCCQNLRPDSLVCALVVMWSGTDQFLAGHGCGNSAELNFLSRVNVLFS